MCTHYEQQQQQLQMSPQWGQDAKIRTLSKLRTFPVLFFDAS